MTQVPASSHVAFALPASVSSVPIGTKLIVDEFGDLIVVGKDGNAGFVGVSDTADETGNTAALSSSLGVLATDKSITVRHSNSATLGQIEARGYLVTAVNAAPADGDLAAGQAWVWFDQTNGAAKLMVKAKTADGTVASAAIALA
jgi:hypothetical protein